MTCKNQRTTYFSLRALTTNANEPQNLTGDSTKVYQNFTSRGNLNLVAGWTSVDSGCATVYR